ncbi:MAG: YggS family pyridoxal phosphate-dependent enzyme [Candidatus Cloacimonetes bacterium]|nr:YggS family pyridoxal phosphate-dependent enzyme [Candidatus Cloacimonadota bacterium]
MNMNLAENINTVRMRIKQAAQRAGRDPRDIKLLAVTKTRSPHMIDAALRNGIQFIAENRVQDAEEKLPLLTEKYREFHFIGHLQSNKIKKLLALAPTLIHSLDKLSTARKLSDHLEQLNRHQDVLIQVNTSGETSKFGVEPQKALDLINDIDRLPNLTVMGLMTIGILSADRKMIRSCFQLLRGMFRELQDQGLSHGKMQWLSMGMTSDFEIAIEEGANIIRIGSAIFGPINYD